MVDAIQKHKDSQMVVPVLPTTVLDMAKPLVLDDQLTGSCACVTKQLVLLSQFVGFSGLIPRES